MPVDDLDENASKKTRIESAFAALRTRLAELRPDVIVVCGDDELEYFALSNFPAFGVYVGESFEGHASEHYAEEFVSNAGVSTGRPGSITGETPVSVSDSAHSAGAKIRTLPSHAGLATGILTGLMKRGFDPAFCIEPDVPRLVGHAFLRPAESITDLRTPIVPVFINCYYAPQPTAKRCYEFGKAMSQAIEEYPEDLRVVVVGSGGLWHTPGAKGAYLNEDFDRTALRYLEAGDIRSMAEHFDRYRPEAGDTSQFIGERGSDSTGLPNPGGPRGGSREMCNWIVASAAAEGHRSIIIDYIPLYASPVGVAFSYCLDL